jgi:DNA-binding CsgD family transcriptional regulator/PAS domain-containing protein
MAAVLPEDLTDAVYRAALEPAAWQDVMELMRSSFPSVAQTFYFLHLEPRHVRPVYLFGVEPRWVSAFDEHYFSPDNPWIRLSHILHRPGVIRTTERLERFLKDTGVLYRSSYYHEWMKPQGFKHNIGNTLLSERGVVANITLFRSADTDTFNNEEVRSFEVLSKHMTRSLQLARRLEQPERNLANVAAFDALPEGVAMVDDKRHLLYANRAMESLLRQARGLTARAGELNATQWTARQALVDLVDGLFKDERSVPASLGPLTLPCEGGGRLSVRAVPLSRSTRPFFPVRPAAFLLVSECPCRRVLTCSEIRHLHGCTVAEARLANLLAEGHGLREAAQSLGITYNTARAYLKLVFQKMGVHSQAQMVAKLLADERMTR